MKGAVVDAELKKSQSEFWQPDPRLQEFRFRLAEGFAHVSESRPAPVGEVWEEAHGVGDCRTADRAEGRRAAICPKLLLSLRNVIRAVAASPSGEAAEIQGFQSRSGNGR